MMTLLRAELCLLSEVEQLSVCICVIVFLHPLPSKIRHHLVLTPFLWIPYLEQAQARPKESTKRSAGETVISPAKPVMAMETCPLLGYHIRNSYWSKPDCWDQNKNTTINTEQRDLSVTHRQRHTHAHTPIILVVQRNSQSLRAIRATIRAISVHCRSDIYSTCVLEGYQSLITCNMFYTYASTVYIYTFEVPQGLGIEAKYEMCPQRQVSKIVRYQLLALNAH